MPKSMGLDKKRKAREFLSRRDGWKCYYCGIELIPDGEWEKYTKVTVMNGENSYSPIKEYEPPTLDHIQPLSRGGSNDLTNVVLCCQACNSKKGNR